jgi:hypothetical protein
MSVEHAKSGASLQPFHAMCSYVHGLVATDDTFLRTLQGRGECYATLGAYSGHARLNQPVREARQGTFATMANHGHILMRCLWNGESRMVEVPVGPNLESFVVRFPFPAARR